MDGFGVLTWADGRKYEGYFTADERWGFGIYTYADKSVYRGLWKNGKQHGFGIVQNKDGGKKYTCWKDGNKTKTLDKNAINDLLKKSSAPHEVLGIPEMEWNELSVFTNQLFFPSAKFEEA